MEMAENVLTNQIIHIDNWVLQAAKLVFHLKSE